MATLRSPLEIGATLAAERLIGQANYLVARARDDEASIAAHGWSAQRNQQLQARVLELQQALRLLGQDVVLPEAIRLRQTVLEALEWGQKLLLYLLNALEEQHAAPQILQPPPQIPVADRVRQWLEPLVQAARRYEEELAAWGGGSQYADQGEQLLGQLEAAEEALPPVEVLSASQERVVELKFQLFEMLLKLVRAGRAHWLEDPAAAQAYHLDFLDPRRPIPPELLEPGVQPSAAFQLAGLEAPRPPGPDDMREDFKLETLANGPVEPQGEEEVPAMPQEAAPRR